jgi:hypothetical protein
MKKKGGHVQKQAHAPPRWIAPPVDVVKINVDSSVGKNLNKGAVAAVARDANGCFVGASAVIFLGRSEPETLEALACREAMSLATDILATKVLVASDFLSVVKNFQEGSKGVYAHIILEMEARRKEFLEFSVVFERRLSNQEAHNLARFAVHSDIGRLVWLVDPPAGVNIPVIVEP